MTIVSKVEEYVKNHTYLRTSLAKGLINLSSLSRQIAKDLDLDNFHAVHIALRRMNFTESNSETKSILKNSRIEIRTGMSVLIGKDNLPRILEVAKKANSRNEEFHLLQEPGVWVLIAPSRHVENLKKYAFKTYTDVVELVVKSPPSIEDTPGVMAEISIRVADANVNIIEFLSCWTDTLLIIDKGDLPKAVAALEI